MGKKHKIVHINYINSKEVMRHALIVPVTKK